MTKCKWCGTDTDFEGTKMCNDCWELDKRIPSKEQIVIKMLHAAGFQLANLGPQLQPDGTWKLVD